MRISRAGYIRLLTSQYVHRGSEEPTPDIMKVLVDYYRWQPTDKLQSLFTELGEMKALPEYRSV